MHHKIIIAVLLFFSLLVFSSAAKIAPDFTLKDLNGRSHSLSEYRGKVVLLNFWASWCPPCRAEMPSMQKLQKDWNSKKYAMLAVNLGEKPAKVKEFMARNKYTFPVLLDLDRTTAKQYGITGIPATFIISKDGHYLAKEVGARDWTAQYFESKIK